MITFILKITTSKTQLLDKKHTYCYLDTFYIIVEQNSLYMKHQNLYMKTSESQV